MTSRVSSPGKMTKEMMRIRHSFDKIFVALTILLLSRFLIKLFPASNIEQYVSKRAFRKIIFSLGIKILF